MADEESGLRRRLRILLRRLNLFDSSRTRELPQANVSGPSLDPKSGSRRG